MYCPRTLPYNVSPLRELELDTFTHLQDRLNPREELLRTWRIEFHRDGPICILLKTFQLQYVITATSLRKNLLAVVFRDRQSMVVSNWETSPQDALFGQSVTDVEKPTWRVRFTFLVSCFCTKYNGLMSSPRLSNSFQNLNFFLFRDLT